MRKSPLDPIGDEGDREAARGRFRTRRSSLLVGNSIATVKSSTVKSGTAGKGGAGGVGGSNASGAGGDGVAKNVYP